jgi:hypothetical protein
MNQIPSSAIRFSTFLIRQRSFIRKQMNIAKALKEGIVLLEHISNSLEMNIIEGV